MKKIYTTPAVEIENTEMNQMIALSLKGDADNSLEILTDEDQDLNIWSDADTDEE